MKKRKNTRTLSRYLSLPILAAAALLLPSSSQATPYATSVTNTGTTISFRLNESGIVTLQYTNLAAATVTTNLNQRPLGLTVTNIAIPGAFSIIVAKTNTAPGYLSGAGLLITAEGTNGVATNTLRFNSPRGVAINTNPASAYFGRIYVANSAAGTTAGGNASAANTNRGDGLYLLNADYTDAVGQGTNARNAGLPFTAPPGDDASTPFRIEVGQDNNIYIADSSTNSAGIWVTDPDVLTGTNAIVGLGFNGNGLSPSTNHGRIISSVYATGSTNTGDLVLYAIDTDNTVNADPLDLSPNHIMKWAVGSGPFPVDLTVGVTLTNIDDPSLLPVSNIAVDLARGPDGKFYTLQYRLVDGSAGIFVVDPAVDNNANGLADPVYSSLNGTTTAYGSTRDFFFQSRAVAISPDGKYIAVLRDDNQITIANLTNGIPDLNSRRQMVNGNLTTLGRDITFDAAGNIYAIGSAGGQQVLRAYSPGYITKATTTWSPTGPATFSVTNITPNEVRILATATNAAEPNVNGEFTFERSGDLSSPLTVTYVISGTATRGADYQTNVFGIGGGPTNTVTFAAGVAATNVVIAVIDNPFGELVETVNFTLVNSTNYITANNQAATVFIADDGDLPAVSVKALGLGFNELLVNRPAKFVVSIAAVWTSDINANIALTGDAVSGVDYSEPATFTVTIPQGQTTVTNLIHPIDNSSIAPDKTLIYSLVSDPGYTNSGAFTVTNTLRNDDLAPLPILFSDDFDVNSAANWKTNAVLVDNDALFAYDYNNDGVPPAPHTPGGATTLGLRLRSHYAIGGVTNGISTSPIGLVLTNDYRLRFDAWMNFNGPAPAGGTGSSEFLLVGMGVSENRTNVVASNGSALPMSVNLPGSSVFFAVDGDGGFTESVGDFLVFSNGVPLALNTNIYPANARDSGGAYYAEFGDIQIPAAQTSVFPSQQTGVSAGGALAFTWHDVIATKIGNTFTLDIDGLRIANVNYPLTLVGSNFSLGYSDWTTNINSLPAMNSAIIDNLTVEKLAPSTNATLASLTLAPGASLIPSFNAGTVTYSATNGLGTNYTVTAGIAHPAGTLQLKVNGGGFTALTSGVASGTLPLVSGNNTVVVRVTAPDLTTVKDYTINVFMFASGPSLTVPTLVSSLSGTTLSLSWPPDHLGFSLQTQTNALSAGLGTNWFTVPGSASVTNTTITVDPTKPTVFYRLVYP